MATAGGSVDKPIEEAIHGKLTSLLRPSILKITNDSWQHRHHAAMREQGGGNNESRKFAVSHKETCLSLVCAADFSIQVVSEEFVGKTTMQRHRMIYAALSEELKNGIHALSLNTKTHAEILKAEAHTPQGPR
ncbi:bola-like protein [Russula emetica]|nr:bola-like protein [Russula emetica]